MYKKFCIVLLVTIFYNGVIYSSPTKEDSTELTQRGRETASTEVKNQGIHSVEPTTIVPHIQTDHAESSTVETSSNHSEGGKNILNNSSIVDAKVINEGSGDISVNDNKNLNRTLSNSNTTSIMTSGPNADTYTNTPLTNSKPTTNVSPKNDPEMLRPIIAGHNTTLVTTVASGVNIESPATKPTVATTTPPATKSTDRVQVEHNSPREGQGNRFDGASFVGGIVLTVGLTAIGFIAFKYYKSGKIDGNYRTL